MPYQNLKNLLQVLEKPKTRAELINSLSVTSEHVDKLLSLLTQQNWLKKNFSKNASYILNHKPNFLDKEYIKNSVREFEKNCHIEVFDILDSTNNYLLHNTFLANNKLEICLADMQTDGKGRFKRTWLSPFCQNIYMSLSLKTTHTLVKLSPLSLIIGLAIVKTLNNFHTGFKIKWPNDIYHEAKKISGILIETKPCTRKSTLVVIGIGININMLLKTVTTLTSLHQITGKYWNRNIILPVLIENVINYSNLFLSSNFSEFQKEWKKYDYLYNKNIVVGDKNNREMGVYIGVNEDGKILLKNKSIIKSIPMHYSVNSF